jgi:hypothetical protein
VYVIQRVEMAPLGFWIDGPDGRFQPAFGDGKCDGTRVGQGKRTCHVVSTIYLVKEKGTVEAI